MQYGLQSQNKVPKGYLILPYPDGTVRRLWGGPFWDCPSAMPSIKMAREINAAHTINIPTEDFSVPDETTLIDGMLKAVKIMATHHDLFVGCMGGVGRTGLFMAAMVKAFGIPDPIIMVRSQYNSRAVETKEQAEFIQRLDVSKVADYLNSLTFAPPAPITKQDSLFIRIKKWFGGFFS